MEAALELTTQSAGETQDLGRFIGEEIMLGDLILLSGELGSGKTTLAQGIAWGLGATGYAHSPTFVLVNEYPGRVTLYHIDLYRVDDPGEVEELAISEMLGQGACIVEWAEKALTSLPGEHLSIQITASGSGPDQRQFRFAPHGELYARLMASLHTFTRAHRHVAP